MTPDAICLALSLTGLLAGVLGHAAARLAGRREP